MFTILFTNHLGSVIRILNSNLGVLFFFLMKKPTNFGIVFFSRAPGYAEGKKKHLGARSHDKLATDTHRVGSHVWMPPRLRDFAWRTPCQF
jgi:hypothetical protein